MTADSDEADHDDAAVSVPVGRDAGRHAALVAYHDALQDPALRSSDEITRARALVALADAKDAYAAAGGSPGGRFSGSFTHVYDEARRVVADHDAAASS